MLMAKKRKKAKKKEDMPKMLMKLTATAVLSLVILFLFGLLFTTLRNYIADLIWFVEGILIVCFMVYVIRVRKGKEIISAESGVKVISMTILITALDKAFTIPYIGYVVSTNVFGFFTVLSIVWLSEIIVKRYM